MKKFMDKNFLLQTDTARTLFHSAAAKEPVFDYHCHLPPEEIAADKQFGNLTEIWLGGDHYKWRQMRAAGIPEKYITGDADPYGKFLAWAQTLENLPGNPLYHWTHLELQRYFDIYEPLTVDSAPRIWKEANRRLTGADLSVKGIFAKMNVRAVGTTDDPVDSLPFHAAIAAGTAPIGTVDTKVLPTFRPDNALNVTAPGFAAYIQKLSAAAAVPIAGIDDVAGALVLRLDYFISRGCTSADFGFDYLPFAVPADKNAAGIVFKKAVAGEAVTPLERDIYRTALFTALAGACLERGIVMQLHSGALRNNNQPMMRALGADTGFDASNDCFMSGNLAQLLNHVMEKYNAVPKMILYSLNPKDYYPMATIAGCFQGGGFSDEPSIPGRIQLGAAWWFCDHKDGMTEQLRILANLGMLPAFAGMLTDSRSFLSYPRHEYFRRIFCNLLGTWVENGEFPNDKTKLTEIVRRVSFANARSYFDTANR